MSLIESIYITQTLVGPSYLAVLGKNGNCYAEKEKQFWHREMEAAEGEEHLQAIDMHPAPVESYFWQRETIFKDQGDFSSPHGP